MHAFQQVPTAEIEIQAENIFKAETTSLLRS
jgi:hypothetical protein